MYVDALRLTTLGEQAIINMNSGGIEIKPTRFMCGEYTGATPTEVPESLLGDEIASGKLAYVEVLSQNSARFVFDVTSESPAYIGEILIQLADNVPLGHVVLREKLEVSDLFAVRISLFLHTQYDITSILDVQMSEHSTIPSVAFVEDLPFKDTVHVNTVSVLNLHTNSDGSQSPGLAYKYGAGGYHWGFSEHDRLQTEVLGDSFISDNTFSTDLPLSDQEMVIIQVVAGSGNGHVRQFKMDGGQLVNEGSPIPHIGPASTISIWRRISTPTGGTSSDGGLPWPEVSDVPEGWLLSRGKQKLPMWVPPAPSQVGPGLQATLFNPPGKLICRAMLTTAKPGQLTYPMPEEIASSNMVFCGLGGTFQPRSAFSIRGKHFDLSESVDASLNLDLRMFQIEPSQGHSVRMVVVQARGDGQTSEFDIPEGVENADYVIATVGRIMQPTSSYKVKDTKLAFTDIPESGRAITLICMIHEERAGWTSAIRSAGYGLLFEQSEFILPTTPVSKDHVIMTENGLIIDPDGYRVVDNMIYTTNPIPKGRYVEVVIVENLMSIGSKDSSIVGVITDVTSGPRGFEFHRQGLPTLSVPLPELNFRGGPGIKIDGTYPNYVIQSTAALDANEDPKRVYSQHQRIEDSEELVVVQRVEFNKGILLSATADFHVELGPGFSVSSGSEHIEYVLGIRGPAFPEPEYARGVKGSASAGFTILNAGESTSRAFSNASISSINTLLRENHKSGYIEVVAKIRVVGADVTAYSSKIGANVCIKVEPV